MRETITLHSQDMDLVVAQAVKKIPEEGIEPPTKGL